MLPTHINRIISLRVNSLNSGSLNLNNAIHKGYQGNEESVGGQLIIRDGFLSPATQANLNATKDPDLLDQPQLQL